MKENKDKAARPEVQPHCPDMEEGELEADLSKDNIATTDMDLDTSVEMPMIIEEKPPSPGEQLPQDSGSSGKIVSLLDLPLGPSGIKANLSHTTNRCLVQIDCGTSERNSDSSNIPCDKDTTSAKSQSKSGKTSKKSTDDIERLCPPCMSQNLQYPVFEIRNLNGEAYSTIYDLIEKLAEQLSGQNKVKFFPFK